MNNVIYYVLGVLAIIYLVILFKNKGGRKRRRSRQFMDGKRRHNDNK